MSKENNDKRRLFHLSPMDEKQYIMKKKFELCSNKWLNELYSHLNMGAFLNKIICNNLFNK